MGKFLFFIFGILVLVLFSSPQKVRAAGDVVINEVYPTPSIGPEWIELYNNSESDSLAGFTIEDGNGSRILDLSSYTIPIGGYLLLEKTTDFTFELNTAGDIVILKKDSELIDQVRYGNWLKPIDILTDNAIAPLVGQSIARIPNGHDSDDDATDFIIQAVPTPGEKNPSPPPTSILLPPMSPTNLQTEINNDIVKFIWVNSDIQPLSFEIIISKAGDTVVDEVLSDPVKLEYQTELDWGIYSWQVVASNGVDEVSTNGMDFELMQPIYSKNIIVNEVLPHPSNGVDNEFIELYNSGLEEVDLSGWFLDDDIGGSISYLIPVGTIIRPGGYLSFYKINTKLSLSDSGDAARLLFPDGAITSACFFTEYASIDLAWARDVDGDWEWTEKLTPGTINDIYLTPEEDDENGMGGEEEEIVINKIPIDIKTGEFRDFDQKLVAVSGTVITTSGNTFYLDDGSGQAKIYIQDKTGIDKPPMHKGDIFEVIGIVNLYRNTWRILPQKQSDVKLIQAIKDLQAELGETTKSSTATVKSSTAGKTTAQARAPTVIEPIIKQVKAAEISTVTQKEAPKISWWTQIAKALTGLAVIFLVLLIIKVRRFPKVKVIGGHFGDDDT